jgi:hypothetical protein
MSLYLKCACPHCGQSIEYPAEGTGQEAPCPTCQKLFVLKPGSLPVSYSPSEICPENLTNEPEQRKAARNKLSKLTEETISRKTTAGNNQLHFAAKLGHIDLIPSHLLTEELLIAKNRDGNTPIHIAAMHGHLHQIPSRFLTKKTVTIPGNTWITGSGYRAQGPTALYAAAISGHVDQIPREFFIPECLLIETTGYRHTLLQQIVKMNRLDLLPKDYATSELWNAKDTDGHTPLQHLEYLVQLEAENVQIRAQCESNLAAIRNSLPTAKQLEKLRWFGINTDKIATKGQASDELDQCVRSYPDRERAYYNRPPTEDQLEKLRKLNEESLRIDGEESCDLDTLTYGEAKDIIQQDEWARRKAAEEQEFTKFSNPLSKGQLAWLIKSGIKLDPSARVKEWELEYIIGLEKLPPSEEDLSFLRQHGVVSFQGDGFGAYVFADLIRSFGGSAQNHNRASIDYGPPCQAALRDPAYHKPTLTYNEGEHTVEFTWPKSKITEWLRRQK